MTVSAKPTSFTQEILVKLKERYASMFVRIWKPEGTPRASVFCIHEFSGNGADFDFLAAFLCRNGFQVVCPDMLGRGRSAFLADPASYDVDLLSRCLSAMAEFALEENHFIGASWGATGLLLSWHFKRWRISKLIMIDPPMTGSATLDAIRDGIRKDADAEFASRTEAETHVLTSLSTIRGIEASVLKKLAANRVIEARAGFRLAFDVAATGNFGNLRGRDYNLFPIAEQISAPQLLMFAEDHPLFDQTALDRHLATGRERFAAILPSGTPSTPLRVDQALLILGFLTAARFPAGG